jgi:hypothetical protein
VGYEGDPGSPGGNPWAGSTGGIPRDNPLGRIYVGDPQRFWDDSGSILKRFCVYSGSILRRFWNDYALILGRFERFHLRFFRAPARFRYNFNCGKRAFRH